MILYHGSNMIVKNPKIIDSLRGKDFGCAFYLTPVKEQAERMAKRKHKIMLEGNPIVSVFEWDENLGGMSHKSFKSANIEWLDFIINCRSNPKFKHEFDIIEGKIADDSVGETILFVMDGKMRKEDAVKKLKFQHINYQIAFCTEKSLSGLKFVSSYRVK